jgi:hypothetical protein
MIAFIEAMFFWLVIGVLGAAAIARGAELALGVYVIRRCRRGSCQ